MTKREGTIRLELIAAARTATFSGEKFKNDLITLSKVIDKMIDTGNCKEIMNDLRVKATEEDFVNLISQIGDPMG